MNLETLLPPIAAATILNVFAFAGLWRAGEIERRTGSIPWYVPVGACLYGAPLTVFFYFARSKPLVGGFDVFAAAAIAQAFGAGIVYGLVRAFVSTRDQTWKERAPIVLVSAFLLFVVVAASLKG